MGSNREEISRIQWKYFNDLVKARGDHIWRLGAIFVPTSFLIFSWAIISLDKITGYNYSNWLFFLLFIASITCYFFWGFIHLRAWVLDQISIEKMKDIERNLCFEVHRFLEIEMEKFQLTKSIIKTLHWFFVPPLLLVLLWFGYFAILFQNDWISDILIVFPLILTSGIAILVIFWSFINCNIKTFEDYKRTTYPRRYSASD
jgi:hypothetical protein